MTDARPLRSVTDVGPGDFVKVGSRWEKIVSNTAHGAERTPRQWTVRTEHAVHDMYDIDRYAKAEDFDEDARCPYCGATAATVQDEIEHMNSVHPRIVTERLRNAGFSWQELEELARKAPLPADLQTIVKLANDLAFYRSVADDGGLGEAAWVELHFAVRDLPERPSDDTIYQKKSS